MTVTLIQGDCRAEMNALPAESVDVIVADPPYNQTGLSWDRRVLGWLPRARRVLKPNGTLWVFGSLRSFLAMAGEFEGWQLVQDLVWEKQNGSGFDRERFRRVHEQAAQFRKVGSTWADVYRSPQFTMDARKRTVSAKATRVPHTGKIGPHVYSTEEGGPRLMRSVLQVRNTHRQGTGHPTAKPVSLLERIVAYSCPPEGLVLDPFAGSGSTGEAALAQLRRATLIEIDDKYCALIRARLDLPSRAPRTALQEPSPAREAA